jgi:hypothetical protein
MLEFAPIVIVVVLVGVGIYISWMLEKKRTTAWEALADELGLAFLGESGVLQSACSSFKLFMAGHSRKVKNVLDGEAGGVELTLADYQYTTGSGKNQTTHRQTVCKMTVDSLHLPHFYLRPQRSLFDLLGKLFGGQDINFEEDPEFSKHFVLQGEDEGAIRTLFTPTVRGFFNDHHRERLHFEAREGILVFHRGKRCKPQEATQLMELGFSAMAVIQGEAV